MNRFILTATPIILIMLGGGWLLVNGEIVNIYVNPAVSIGLGAVGIGLGIYHFVKQLQGREIN